MEASPSRGSRGQRPWWSRSPIRGGPHEEPRSECLRAIYRTVPADGCNETRLLVAECSEEGLARRSLRSPPTARRPKSVASSTHCGRERVMRERIFHVL